MRHLGVKKKIKKIVEANEKRKNTEKIDTINEIKISAAKKGASITAKKIVEKYKSMKRLKKIYLVNEEDLETIDYNEELQEDLFRGESIVEAANKVLDFKAFKKQQEAAINDFNLKRKAKEEVKLADIIKVPKKRKTQKDKAALLAAKKISKKYKNLRFR